jgi:hypothetical protein
MVLCDVVTVCDRDCRSLVALALDLSANQLTGTIPESLGSLTRLP